MATTNESNQKDAEDFAAGFQDDKQPAVQSEDEAFGLSPDEAPSGDTPTGTAPSEAVVVGGDKGAEGSPAEEASETPAEEAAEPADGPAAAAPAAAAPALDVEKETQRLKSWEGRLKAQQAALDAGKNGGASDETPAEEAAESPTQEAQELVAGAVEGDDADMKALSDDFGPEFVKMITAIVTKVAAKSATDVATKHTAPYRQDIDEVIAELKNEKQRNHYEKIADSHPDFMDIANSPDFKSWIDGQDPTKKAETERIANAGNAKEIIGMLTQYKTSLPADAPGADDMSDALDNAEGVRSTGMKLPEAPAKKDDFAAAWNEH